VEVNAGLYGSSSFLSRLSEIEMLIAPQSMCTLTCCMLPCIFHTRTSWMICAKSGLRVPHRYWLHIRARPSRMTLDFKAIRCGCISSKVAYKVLWTPLPQRVHCRFAFQLSQTSFQIHGADYSWHGCLHWAYWTWRIWNSRDRDYWNYWNWRKCFPQVRR